MLDQELKTVRTLSGIAAEPLTLCGMLLARFCIVSQRPADLQLVGGG